MRFSVSIFVFVAGYSAYAAAPAPEGFETIVKPFVKQNCVGCHNAQLASGDFNLQQFLTESVAAALEDREQWEKVIRRIRAGEMPPSTTGS